MSFTRLALSVGAGLSMSARNAASAFSILYFAASTSEGNFIASLYSASRYPSALVFHGAAYQSPESILIASWAPVQWPLVRTVRPSVLWLCVPFVALASMADATLSEWDRQLLEVRCILP